MSFLTTEYIYMAVFMVRNALRNLSFLLCAAHVLWPWGLALAGASGVTIVAAWQNSVTCSLRNADACHWCLMAGL